METEIVIATRIYNDWSMSLHPLVWSSIILTRQQAILTKLISIIKMEVSDPFLIRDVSLETRSSGKEFGEWKIARLLLRTSWRIDGLAYFDRSVDLDFSFKFHPFYTRLSSFSFLLRNGWFSSLLTNDKKSGFNPLETSINLVIFLFLPFLKYLISSFV